MKTLIVLQAPAPAALGGVSPVFLLIGVLVVIILVLIVIPSKNNNNSQNQSQNSTNGKGLSYVSAIGSSISLVCFFAPWIGCSDKTLSGADLGGQMWIVFVTSAISLMAFIFFKSLKTLSKAKIIILLSTLAGLGFMLFKYSKFQSNNDWGIEIKWGSIATLAGMIISLFGVAFLTDEGQPVKGQLEIEDNKSNKIHCSNCGKSFTYTSDDQFCDQCGSNLYNKLN